MGTLSNISSSSVKGKSGHIQYEDHEKTKVDTSETSTNQGVTGTAMKLRSWRARGRLSSKGFSESMRSAWMLEVSLQNCEKQTYSFR